MTMDLLGSSRDQTFYGPSKGLRFRPQIQGPISGPRIEGPHSAGGSTQVHEGPHRDHGNVLHNAKHGHGPIKVLKGPHFLWSL